MTMRVIVSSVVLVPCFVFVVCGNEYIEREERVGGGAPCKRLRAYPPLLLLPIDGIIH
jgi:hypothetical protein